MSTSPNRVLRFSSFPRKGRSANPLDAEALSVSVDAQSSLASMSRRKHRAVDDVFHTLLADANQELANLLRDVGTESNGVLLGDTRSQQVSELLMRAVRCAAKQYMLQAELGNLALTDELTGLYNRRGFMALAERQLKLGHRSGRGMLLFMIDVDGMKQINDSFGHLEGDHVLKRLSLVLEDAFRDSDVLARLGGDEFAVLAIEAADHSEATIKARLLECLRSVKNEESRYEISLCLGLARFDPSSSASIEELLTKADQAMYEQKRRRGRPSAAAVVEASYQTQ